MKKHLTLIILLLLALLIPITHPRAQSATDSASPSADQEVTENLKKRLQDSLKNAKQNIIQDEEEPKAFVGTVQDLIQETIEIQTKNGVRYAKTNQDSTIIRSPGNSEINLDDVRIDDFIISMGYLENDTTVIGKRIIVSQNIEPELQKTTGRGKILELTPYTITLENEEILNLSSETVVKTKSEILESTSLKEGQELIYTAKINNDELDATNIMIISPLPSPKPNAD